MKPLNQNDRKMVIRLLERQYTSERFVSGRGINVSEKQSFMFLWKQNETMKHLASHFFALSNSSRRPGETVHRLHDHDTFRGRDGRVILKKWKIRMNRTIGMKGKIRMNRAIGMKCKGPQAETRL